MIKQFGTAKVNDMHPAAKRLANLKELLKNEPDKKSLYAQDLRLLIKSCEDALRHVSEDGYMMVEV
jgi:hypothetical protein